MSWDTFAPETDSPAVVMHNLTEIERDLSIRQNALEAAARAWAKAKRDQKHAHAIAFISAEGTVAQREAIATRETILIGKNEEAEWVALNAVVDVMQTRAGICQSLLKAQGRS
jgi:hypothetical protein